MASFRHVGFGIIAATLFCFIVAIYDLAGLRSLIVQSADGGAILALLLVTLVFLFSGLGALLDYITQDGLEL
ncbi:MAG: hypothetical protein HXY25_10325 [Alphaproteobacteria bacterium]|nr:hypothetical protein [Alphaproteobacteria bacterium]